MPGELLRFNGPTEYAIQALEKGEIFCQHYSAYNDPDLSPKFPPPHGESLGLN